MADPAPSPRRLTRRQSLSSTLSRRGEEWAGGWVGQHRRDSGTARACAPQPCAACMCSAAISAAQVSCRRRPRHQLPSATRPGARILVLCVDNQASRLALRMAAALLRPHDELQVSGGLQRAARSGHAACSMQHAARSMQQPPLARECAPRLASCRLQLASTTSNPQRWRTRPIPLQTTGCDGREQ